MFSLIFTVQNFVSTLRKQINDNLGNTSYVVNASFLRFYMIL